MAPSVTVVIATHNRPQGLIRALRSVCRQRGVRWQALVIGDACDPATGQAIATLADPRIRYLNLSARTGEQSLPNSVGLSLADTPCLALLNHDDIWFPDHLARALAGLARTGADLWTSQAVEIAPRTRARPARPPDASGLAAHLPFRVGHRTRPGRHLIDALTQGYLLFEPASSWVLRATAWTRVGPFTPAAHLHRTPVEDWILRAARAGIVHVDGAQVTVVKESRLRPAGQTTEYAADNTPADALTALFRLRPAAPVLAVLRHWLDAQATGHAGTVAHGGPTWGHDLPDGLPAALTAAFATLGPGSAARFLDTGTDDFSAALDAQGVARGWRLRRSLRRRTGEALPDPPDLATLIAAARQELSR